MYNLLLGGAAGDGIETMSSLLEKLLKKSGFYVFTIHDFMSRVRGGHNFAIMRFGRNPVDTHRDELDGIYATNMESYKLHEKDLKADGFVICDTSLDIQDTRAYPLPLRDIAKELGNVKAMSSVAIGAILALFDLVDMDSRLILEKNMKQALIEINAEAIQRGQKLLTPRYPHATNDLDQHILISGVESLTLGAISAGLKFYSAYPMSPSTGILEYLTKHGSTLDIVVEQAEDEIAGINMAIGAAYAGAPAMSGSSGGGFCLMVEAIGFSGIAEIPLVIVDMQRPGPATGLPTRTEQSDLNFVINASQGEYPRMVIALRNHTDAFYQGARAMKLAQKYQLPVIILGDQYLGDTTATIPTFDLDKLYQDDSKPAEISLPYKRYAFTESGISPQLYPGMSEHLIQIDSDEHDEDGWIIEDAEARIKMMDKRFRKMKGLEAEMLEPEFFGNETCTTLLVGFGSTYGAIKEAVLKVNEQGENYGALVFGDVYPLPTKLLKHYAKQVETIISVEQNATAQLANLMSATCAIVCDQYILKYDGRQLTSKYIMDGLLHSSKEEIENDK